MFSKVFHWLDIHPSFYGILSSVVTAFFLGWIIADSIKKDNRSNGDANNREWLFIFSLLLILLVWRWPYLFIPFELNPDESQQLAGGLALLRDPIFWRSVDGTTSGPLNFYAILPVFFSGTNLSYFSIRLTGLFFNGIALVACYRLFRQIHPETAKLAILPPLMFFAAATGWDLLHYSSEQLCLPLFGFAALCLLAPARNSFYPEKLRWTGVALAGLMPWAKLQSVPLAGAFVAIATVEIMMRPFESRSAKYQQSIKLLIAAASPTLIALALVIGAGQWDPFFRRYIVQNFAYVGEKSDLAGTLLSFYKLSIQASHFPAYLGGSLSLLGISCLILWRRKIRPNRLMITGAILTGAAIICILTPRRPFLHYLMFLSLPLALLTGGGLGTLWPQAGTRLRGMIITVVLGGCTLLPAFVRWNHPTPEIIGQFTDYWKRPLTPIGAIARAFAEPGETMAVWGWLSNAYVESGLRPATRDTISYWSLLPSSQQAYYRQTYLNDMRRRLPGLFIDSVGPGAQFFSDRKLHAHETFPALATLVDQHYTQLLDLGYARIYVRQDLWQRHPLSTTTLQALYAQGRPRPLVNTAPEEINPASASRMTIDDQNVLMVLPPTEVTWQLKPIDRGIELDYGFAPQAYTEGHSNGAELIVELRSPGAPARQLFYRHLHPANVTSDRGKQSVRLDLPPFSPNSQLVVRTQAGEAGDTAWDWLYLADSRFIEAPFYTSAQFPRFNRTPTHAIADRSFLQETGSERLLALAPPVLLTYVLDGHETRLNLAYGFQTGAYTQGGQTDGAIFSVIVNRRNHPKRVLWEKYLDPIHQEHDRGNQKLTLPLSDIQAQDSLELHIQPGQSDSWDWTYLTDLEIR